MQRCAFFATFCVVLSFSVGAQAVQQSAPDTLGLDKASAEAQGKTPIAVAAAIEASHVTEALPGVLAYYFTGWGYGQRSAVYSTELGNELQPRIGDLMMKLGYAPIAPQTGFQGTQSRTVQAELKTQPAATPKYVIVPTISFENVESKGQQVNLRPLAGIIGAATGNNRGTASRTARTAANTAANSQVGQAQQIVKATFALRYYNRDGIQIRVDEACSQEITSQDAQALNAALIYQTATKNTSTLKPLADKLMDAMEEKMNRPGTVCNAYTHRQ